MLVWQRDKRSLLARGKFTNEYFRMQHGPNSRLCITVCAPFATGLTRRYHSLLTHFGLVWLSYCERWLAAFGRIAFCTLFTIRKRAAELVGYHHALFVNACAACVLISDIKGAVRSAWLVPLGRWKPGNVRGVSDLCALSMARLLSVCVSACQLRPDRSMAV